MDKDMCLGGWTKIVKLGIGEGRLNCLIAYEYSLHELVELLT